MGYRIFYGAVVLIALYSLFWLDVAIAYYCVDLTGPFGSLLRRGSIIPIFILLLLLRAGVELDTMMRSKGANPHSLFAYLMIGILYLTPWFCSAGWLGSGPNQREDFYWMVIWLVITVIGTGMLTVARQKPEGSFRDVGATLMIILYLGFMGSFTLLLRSGQDLPTEKGAWLLLVVVMVTKVSDIGAYFAGSTLGKHKLVPKISPGKTVEGAIGGIMASALMAIFVAKTSSLFHATDFSNHSGSLVEHATQAGMLAESTVLPIIRAGIFGVAISVAGQIGDLFESCFKRDSGSKDSGKVIPRYGGILDLLDSPVLAVPVAWFLLVVVWKIV